MNTAMFAGAFASTKCILLISWLLTNHDAVGAASVFPNVLIVSMDAFRPDYVEECLTPNIWRLRSSGVYAPFMKNVFPTKTLPNHHSIATGVQPEVHGVLDSTVYASKDCCSNKTLIGYSYELYHYNNGILPIWTLNQLSGKGRHSGVMMWPGGEFPYGCKRTLPTFFEKWNVSVSYTKRIETVISWFLHEQTPTNLVMLYLEEPDLHGHGFGIDSPEIRNQIKNVDKAVGYLHHQLQKHSLDDVVSVFVVSDHGMINLNQKNIIDLNYFVKNSTYVRAGYSPVLQIFPTEGKEKYVITGLQKASEKFKNQLDVYTKDNIPSVWHFAASNRTPPILVVAKEGYAFQDFYKNIEELNNKFNIEANPRNKYGIHGYSNTLPSMHPFFFAWGPILRSGIVLDPFNTTELYPLWAWVLGLEVEHTLHSLPNFSMLHSNPFPVERTDAPPYTVLGLQTVTLNRTSPVDSHLSEGAPVWAHWFSGLVALLLLVIIIGLIVCFCCDMHRRTVLQPVIPQQHRSIAENQHLLVSDSEDEVKL